MSTGIKRTYHISPSQLGSLLGVFGHHQRVRAIQEVVSRSPYAHVLKMLLETDSLRTDFAATAQAYGIDTEWRDVMRVIQSVQYVEDVHEAMELARTVLVRVPDEDIRERMLSWMHKKACCNYGLSAEGVFVAAYNRTHESQVVDTQLKLSRELVRTTKSGIHVILHGRIDGRIECRAGGAGSLLEIKNRTVHIPDAVPAGDMFQMHAYMFMADVPRVTLAQCVRSRGDCLYEMRDVRYDADVWQLVTDGLFAVLNMLDQIACDFVTCECFRAMDTGARSRAMQGILRESSKGALALASVLAPDGGKVCA